MMSSVGATSSCASGEDNDSAKGNLAKMKKRLTLDLEAPKSARKQRMNELLSTPELDKLKLTTPELERLIMQQSGLTVNVIPGTNPLVATPTSFLNPKNVSEEEEQYVKPFEAALAQLHHESGTSASVPGLRFTPFPSTDSMPLPSDLTDVPIGRAASTKPEVHRSPERDPQRFQAVASTMAAAAAAAAARSVLGIEPNPFYPHVLPVPQPPPDMDIKPIIKEEPADLDYSSLGEASCSAYGSSDSMSPDPGRSTRRRSASSRNSESMGVSPIDMEDQEMKKLERKRLRNRIAASKCRARKLERISRLDDRVKQLKGENADLVSVVNKLKEAICSLKEEIVEHVRSGCDINIPPDGLNGSNTTS